MHFRVGLELIDRTAFSTSFQAADGTWTHIVLNYIGPENGQGFRIYYNKAKLDGGSTKSTNLGPTSTPHTPGDGTVVVGRVLGDYTSVAIDELLFFNIKIRCSNKGVIMVSLKLGWSLTNIYSRQKL